jgi:anti-sigma B factor antagonist
LKIFVRTVSDVSILDLNGQLALEGNTLFRKQATALIEAGSRKMILNLAGVEYMDSMGLGEMISCYTTLQRMSGSLKLLHLSTRLNHLLVITKLNTVFETFDSESDAVASFAQSLIRETASPGAAEA